jgi:hypothetical protein
MYLRSILKMDVQQSRPKRPMAGAYTNALIKRPGMATGPSVATQCIVSVAYIEL